MEGSNLIFFKIFSQSFLFNSVFILPALLSRTLPSLSTVAKFTLAATSLEVRSNPIPRADKIPLPILFFIGS